MPLDIDESAQQFIRDHRVARLATSDAVGQPAVVPICYAFDGERLYVALDEKPKSVPDHELKRVRNIRANPRVAVVVDDYSEEWSKLVYVLISGTAEIISSSENASEHRRAVELLREKYPQYRSMKLEERPIIKITPIRIKRWAPVEKGDQR
jgi:PPOX class probable F420-dependent enzyme